MRLNYNPLKRMERLGNGVYYGYLPKIGSNGLCLFASRRAGNWQFNLPKGLTPGDYWFQVYSPVTGWEWSHGIVTHKGVITQIG